MHRVTRWQTKAFVYKFSKIPPRRTLFNQQEWKDSLHHVFTTGQTRHRKSLDWSLGYQQELKCTMRRRKMSVRLFVKAKNLFSHNTDSIDKTDTKSKPTTVREDFFLIFMFLELIIATRTSTRKVKVHFSWPYGNLRAPLLKQSIVIYVLNQFPSNFNLF